MFYSQGACQAWLLVPSDKPSALVPKFPAASLDQRGPWNPGELAPSAGLGAGGEGIAERRYEQASEGPARLTNVRTAWPSLRVIMRNFDF